MRYFFRVEYDGAAYGGWQHQKTAPSIQDAISRAFSIVARTPCVVTGAGRTDAGVHASAQGAHVDLGGPLDIRSFEHSVNALLPNDIAIYKMQTVDDAFHARFSAVSRRYCYRICGRKRPLLYNRTWPVFYTVNWDCIREEAALLPGVRDFTAFCSSGGGTAHARCEVLHSSFETNADGAVFTIEANRFVYNMVRTLVGTLVDIGRGRLTGPLTDIIESKDRRRVGTTAPACGLTLEYVTYQGVDR
jgi:tRNA pseudouridine38-40 synthase